MIRRYWPHAALAAWMLFCYCWNTAKADVVDVHLAAKYALLHDVNFAMRTRHLGIGYAHNIVDNVRLNAGFWETSFGSVAYYTTFQGYTRPNNAKLFTEFGIDMGYRSEYSSTRPVSFALYARLFDKVKVSVLPLYTVAPASHSDSLGGAVFTLSLSFGE